MKIQTESYSNVLRKYPFSLFEMDGSLDLWQKIYSSYIDSIESKIIISKNNHIKTFRNHNFGFSNAIQQRIADIMATPAQGRLPVERRLVRPIQR